MLNTFNLYDIATLIGTTRDKVHFWSSGRTALATDYYLYRPTGEIYYGYAGTMPSAPTTSWSVFYPQKESVRAILKRLAAEAGYTLVTGSFEEGGTVTTVTDALWYQKTGTYYTWGGALPKVVPAGSTPKTSGGIGAGAWSDKTDLTLRSELAGDGGSTKLGIGGGRTQADKNAEWVSITDFAGVVGNSDETGTTGQDCTAALQAALRSGPKSFYIPVGFFRVTDTVHIPSGVSLHGAHMWMSCFVADPAMEGSKDVVQNDGYGSTPLVFDKNIQLDNFRIKANGFSRTKAGETEWGRCLRTGALKGLTINRMVFHEGPQHCLDIACWNDNYVGVGHAGVAQGMTTDVRVTDSYFVDYCYDDGLTTHGVDGVTISNCTAMITDYAKSQHVYAITQNGFEIDDGSSNVVVSNCRTYGNDTNSKGFAVANHNGNPIPFNIRFENCGAYGTVTGVATLGAADETHAFGSEAYRGRNYAIINCSLNYPHVATDNAEFPSRGFDIQYGMDVVIENFRVNMRGSNGEAARSPCTVFNIIGCNVRIDGVRVEGVPDGVMDTIFGTAKAWFRITNTASDNIRIKNVDIDNIGWADRVIRDVDKPTGGALTEVDGIRVGSISTDGRTKTCLMSGAFAEFKNLATPVGMQKYRIGRTLADRTDLFTGGVKLNYGGVDTIVGGLRLFSETSSSGVQPVPGIMFDRQFASGYDPTGVNGKGSVAFRTDDATNGSFSICAYHEDLGEYRPIVYARSTTSPAKAWNPVVDNDTANGEASHRWKVVFAATGSINTSDEREKSAPEAITNAMMDAADEFDIIVYQWLDAIFAKGEDGARWHFGVIAQQVRDAFLARGLDGTRYGFLCYDSWPDQYQDIYEEVVNEEGRIDQVATGEKVLVQTAGDRWGIRPDQCLWLLAAAARRRAQRAEDRLSDIEGRLLAAGI